MLRFSLALGAVLAIALPASVASAGSGSTQLRVFFPKDCQHNVYKPKSFVVTCADANFVVKNVDYSRYGTKSARDRHGQRQHVRTELRRGDVQELPRLDQAVEGAPVRRRPAVPAADDPLHRQEAQGPGPRDAPALHVRDPAQLILTGLLQEALMFV